MMKNDVWSWLLPALLSLPLAATAQSVGIGTTTPDPKAALDVSATDKGLLVPRLTAAQRTAISSPPVGLLVFQTDGTQPGFWYYFGGAWNFDVPGRGYVEFSTPYLGMPQVIRPDGLYDAQQRFGLYRFHVLDPIHFSHRLGVTIQALGWRSGHRYLPLQDDIASTAFFYLDRPVANRPAAPTADLMEIL